jgi:hypothetical protein
MRLYTALLYLSLLCLCWGRLPDSPFPIGSAGLNSSKVLYSVNEDNLTPDDIFTVSTLQGLLARTSPTIYRLKTGSDYNLWAEELQRVWGVQFDSSLSTLHDLLHKFRPAVKGFVLADLGKPSTSAALTLCASNSYIAATPNNIKTLQAAGIPQAYDARGHDVDWAISLGNSSGFTYSKRIAVLQDPTKSFGYLSDYATFAGAITWWDVNMKSPLSQRVLRSLLTPAVLGWGVSEDATVAAASATGGWVHASDWAKNLDTLSSYAMGGHLSQKKRKSTPSLSPADKVHTVTFLMTDGDNIQWLLNNFASGNQWWSDKARGKVPMGWTLSPALIELSSATLSYLYRTASANDYFVAAPSGVGYSYPDLLTPGALSTFSEISANYMKASGLSILNIIGEKYSQTASEKLLAYPEIDAIFWYDYYSYISGHGNITFIHDKPVVSARYQLWDGSFDSVATLIPKLLELPKDPSSADGYSLVTVHVWSNNVTDAFQVYEALQKAGGFDVVTPNTFVERIAKNMRR